LYKIIIYRINTGKQSGYIGSEIIWKKISKSHQKTIISNVWVYFILLGNYSKLVVYMNWDYRQNKVKHGNYFSRCHK